MSEHPSLKPRVKVEIEPEVKEVFGEFYTAAKQIAENRKKLREIESLELQIARLTEKLEELVNLKNVNAELEADVLARLKAKL